METKLMDELSKIRGGVFPPHYLITPFMKGIKWKMKKQPNV